MTFMVSTRMKQAPNEEIFALFPAEQSRTQELFAEGIIEQLYVAVDYSGAWLVCQGETQQTVQAALMTLPLHPFVESEITPLAQLG